MHLSFVLRHSHSHLCEIQIHHQLSHVWLQFLEALSLLLLTKTTLHQGSEDGDLAANSGQWILQCPVDVVPQEICQLWYVHRLGVHSLDLTLLCWASVLPGRKKLPVFLLEKLPAWFVASVTPKSLTMMVFEKIYSCQAMDRYPLPSTAQQGQETAIQLNRAAPCPRSQPPLLPCQRSLWAPYSTFFRKINQLSVV